MSKIALRLHIQPGQIEALLQVKRNDASSERMTGIIDTGAEISLFPIELLDRVEHSIIQDDIELEQAGIAQQSFSAVEAEIKIVFEDVQGNQSSELLVRSWFAKTTQTIIGVRDILDRATLHIDFRQTRSGWIEFD